MCDLLEKMAESSSEALAIAVVIFFVGGRGGKCVLGVRSDQQAIQSIINKLERCYPSGTICRHSISLKT